MVTRATTRKLEQSRQLSCPDTVDPEAKYRELVPFREAELEVEQYERRGEAVEGGIAASVTGFPRSRGGRNTVCL